MFVLVVSLAVYPGRREDFLEAVDAQARATIRDEGGCLWFDVCADRADPLRFILYEIYRDEAAYRAHRETPHFARWREAAELFVADQVNTSTDLLLSLTSETESG